MSRCYSYRTYIGLAASSLFLFTASAQAELSLGLGAASYLDSQKGLETEHLVIPLIAYSGERLNFQFTMLSYRLASAGDLAIGLLAAGRIQGYKASDSRYLVGMDSRKESLDGGIGLDWNGLNFSLTTDLLGKHKGSEMSLGYTTGFDMGKLQLMTGVGVTWQSKELTTYYYGVKPAEAGEFVIDGELFERGHYETDDAVFPKVSLLAKYSLTGSWFLIGGAEINFLPDAITHSPIVENDEMWGVFLGLARDF